MRPVQGGPDCGNDAKSTHLAVIIDGPVRVRYMYLQFPKPNTVNL